MESHRDLCPRCGIGHLQKWIELSDEEKMVVQRLPHSYDVTHPERIKRHRWCTKCWYEDDARQANLA
ncbi:MAG: hypothetical protein ABIP75_18635 [Pyrinomonadaceae bacterium]